MALWSVILNQVDSVGGANQCDATEKKGTYIGSQVLTVFIYNVFFIKHTKDLICFY